MLGLAGGRRSVESAVSFQRARVELPTGSAIDAGSIARSSQAEGTADVFVLTPKHPRQNAEFLSKDLFVNGL